MDDATALAARLLERSQCGEHLEVLAECERILRSVTGDLVDGPPGVHFARTVALLVAGDPRAAIAAATLMLAAADREACPGWLSCAYSVRAHLRLELGGRDAGEYDTDAVLRDLVAAENALRVGVDDPWLAGQAHNGVAMAYNGLRLYELAVPHYTAAYDVSTESAGSTSASAMWLMNLGFIELEWALELYRVGQDEAAEKHSREAETHAVRAVHECVGPDADHWRLLSSLIAASARISCGETQPAMDELQKIHAELLGEGKATEASYAVPFLAIAQSRCGRQDEALTLLDATIGELPDRVTWTEKATLEHTRATILAKAGSAGASADLSYGTTLAGALWRQRISTLNMARTMRSLEDLRAEHERVAQSALTDHLTGIANRRAFDDAVTALREEHGPGRPVAVIMIDLDKFKAINDVEGHDAGDRVLKLVSAALASSLRDGDLVARLGGDEFAAILPGAGIRPAQRVAQHMVAAVDAIEGSVATASVGIASGCAQRIDEVVIAADRAMYLAKRAGGNQLSRGD